MQPAIPPPGHAPGVDALAAAAAAANANQGAPVIKQDAGAPHSSQQVPAAFVEQESLSPAAGYAGIEEEAFPGIPRYIGPVISVSTPTAEDISSTVELKCVLQAAGLFEPNVLTEQREIVLDRLRDLATAWSKRLAVERRLSPEEVGVVMLRVFGSYRLGVNTPDADIDT
jgi:Nucleotidyltransferase domain